ncbi:hypothetical protein EDD63_1561 [Breznakia blatticola]|uniref:LPXTG-motif cell wall-anchored protein n=1 Tax=Breznakia blatticola TaxID=1754012 RepID=A0A4R7Z8H9_9FIRM|nr:hypothetical protein [Breznakia blatticola]TDW10460.1 hypothetical protein EDD63_1561 [Breznakia blatticola]
MRKRKFIFKHKVHKLAIMLLTIAVLLVQSVPILASEHEDGISTYKATGSTYGLKMFGFDYGHDHITNNPDDAEIRWLAEHRDVIIGLYNEGMPENVYDRFTAINPDIQFYAYFAYNSVAFSTEKYMEDWCIARGIDVEELYYHFDEDTWITTRSYDSNTGSFRKALIPGYGPNGSAKTLKEARVPSAWNKPDAARKMYNINPTSQVFRDASQAFMEMQITVSKENGKYLDGFILDTFDGTISREFDIRLEETIELKNLGITNADDAVAQVSQDILDMRYEHESNLTAIAGKEIRLAPNGADLGYILNSYKGIYVDALGSQDYDEMIVEYLTSSGNINKERLNDMKKVYDSMEKGNTWFMNSQTNVLPTQRPANLNNPVEDDSEWHGFMQHIIAVQYIMNHDNAYFAVNQGSASRYGVNINNTFSTTHWYANYDYPIGNPVVRSSKDYWGKENTDRFFLYQSHVDPENPTLAVNNYEVIGREYDNALVLANFCQRTKGGIANVGANRVSIPLDGNYRRLLADNTLGPVINEVRLGTGEGAILIKEDKVDVADYSKVDEAIKKVPSDLSNYTDESVQDLQDALDAVVRGKNKSEQAVVDGYATAIEDAIQNLVSKKADYTKVDTAIASVPSDLTLYTDASRQVLQDALDAVIRDKDKSEQLIVDGYVTAIEDAIQNLVYKDADYTRVDTAITSIPTDLSIYTDESVQDLQDALDAVVRGKDITEQTTVNGYAKAIEDAVAALTVKPAPPIQYADYTKVDEAIAKIPADTSVYTDESVANLQQAKDAVIRNKEVHEQSIVDGYATAIEDAITQLVYKPADYTKVNTAIDNIPADVTLYTPESVQVLTDALAAVNYNKNITEQTLVDQYAKTIEDATAQLTYRAADYSKVDQAIARIPDDLTIYTLESLEVLKQALMDLEFGKNITEQATVDGYATTLNKAIDGLVRKQTGGSNPGNSSNQPGNSSNQGNSNANNTTPNKDVSSNANNTNTKQPSKAPNTADSTNTNLLSLAWLTSFGVILISLRRKFKTQK